MPTAAARARRFYRHAELEQAGIPVLAGIYGTNPAGGGYQGISPTILIAHKDANIAVGGVGIVSGMSPKGGFDVAGLEQLIAETRDMQGAAAGQRRDPLRRDRLLHPRVRRGEGRARRHQGIHAHDPGLRPDVLPRRRAGRAAAAGRATSTTCCRSTRRRPTSSTTSSRAWSTAASTWSSGPTTARRSTPAWSRSTACWSAPSATGRGCCPRAIPSTPTIPGIGGKLYRQGLIKMNEFVTHVRARPRAGHLVPGHDRHRRRRHRRKGGAARPRPVADLLDPADRRADDAGGAAQGQRGGALHHGRARRPTATTPSRSARRPPRSTSCTARPRRWRPTPAARSRTRTRASRCEPIAREDERDGEEVLRHVAPGVLRRATASSTRSWT